MKGLSKFDYGSFYVFYPDERFFAVSKQRYDFFEALALFKQETDCDCGAYELHDAAVKWTACNMDGERIVGWALDLDSDGSEKRRCPVWAFEY